MKYLLIVSALIAAPALGQTTTTCNTVGASTTCNTNVPPREPDNSALLGLIARGGPNAFADAQARNAAPTESGDDSTPASRRAKAYSHVGDLIAKGDCPAAKRLANFYGHADLIADTDQACP